MRRDVRIDRRSITCPNACAYGSGRTVAKPGDLIVYKERNALENTYMLCMGRVLGRISAPKLSKNDRTVRGFAVTMTLAFDGSHVYERWVDPVDIVGIQDVPAAMLAFFALPFNHLPKVEQIREQIYSGEMNDAALTRNRRAYPVDGEFLALCDEAHDHQLGHFQGQDQLDVPRLKEWFGTWHSRLAHALSYMRR